MVLTPQIYLSLYEQIEYHFTTSSNALSTRKTMLFWKLLCLATQSQTSVFCPMARGMVNDVCRHVVTMMISPLVNCMYASLAFSIGES